MERGVGRLLASSPYNSRFHFDIKLGWKISPLSREGAVQVKPKLQETSFRLEEALSGHCVKLAAKTHKQEHYIHQTWSSHLEV